MFSDTCTICTPIISLSNSPSANFAVLNFFGDFLGHDLQVLGDLLHLRILCERMLVTGPGKMDHGFSAKKVIRDWVGEMQASYI